jgi:ribosomal protein L7/L12
VTVWSANRRDLEVVLLPPFDAVLQAAGDKKIQLIKVVRAATGLGLKEAKRSWTKHPSQSREGIDRAEADKLKADLEEAGATVELKYPLYPGAESNGPPV